MHHQMQQKKLDVTQRGVTQSITGQILNLFHRNHQFESRKF